MFGLFPKKETCITVISRSSSRANISRSLDGCGVDVLYRQHLSQVEKGVVWVDLLIVLKAALKDDQASCFAKLRNCAFVIWLDELTDFCPKLVAELYQCLRKHKNRFVFVAKDQACLSALKLCIRSAQLYPVPWSFPVPATHWKRPSASKLQIGLDLSEGMTPASQALLAECMDHTDLVVRIWDPLRTLVANDISLNDRWSTYDASLFSYDAFLGLIDVALIASGGSAEERRSRAAAHGVPSYCEKKGACWGRDDISWSACDWLAIVNAQGVEARHQPDEAWQKHRNSLQSLLRMLGKSVRLAGRTYQPTKHRRVLFVSTNGIGLGHITRLIAVAKHCDETIEPVFAVFSAGVRMVQDAGYHCEHISSNEYLALEPSEWHEIAEQELSAIIRFYQPQAVLYDGNVLYHAVTKAISAAALPLVWLRRGFFQAGVTPAALSAQSFASCLIEPGEAAAAYDQGPSAGENAVADWPRLYRKVPPVTIVDTEDILPQQLAREALSIDSVGLKVLIQVGAGNLKDTESLLDRLLQSIRRHQGVDVYLAEWPIADRPALPREGVTVLREYPLATRLRAFDFVVSATGYNSYHELLLAHMPAIFIPNKYTRLDDQVGRARYAQDHGLGVAADMDAENFDAVIDQMMQSAQREMFSQKLAGVSWENGASEVARFLSDCVAGEGR